MLSAVLLLGDHPRSEGNPACRGQANDLWQRGPICFRRPEPCPENRGASQVSFAPDKTI